MESESELGGFLFLFLGKAPRTCMHRFFNLSSAPFSLGPLLAELNEDALACGACPVYSVAALMIQWFGVQRVCVVWGSF